MSNGWCEGCQFHQYPYYAVPPIEQKGKRKPLLFNSDEDVWDIIKRILVEAEENESMLGKSFDKAKSVSVLMPFFACQNIFLKKEYQTDVSMHVYCTDFGVPPHPGHFGNQPQRWVEKSHIIKNALIKRENLYRERESRKTKNAQ